MILYLLVHIFILGIVNSQTANMTVGELSRVDRNQTFNGSITQNSTMKSGDAMSSLNKDEKRQIEDELENNQTSAVIREDDESFQEQEIEFPARHCLQDVLIVYSHSHCGAAFRQEMLSISTENWCVLENIIRCTVAHFSDEVVQKGHPEIKYDYVSFHCCG